MQRHGRQASQPAPARPGAAGPLPGGPVRPAVHGGARPVLAPVDPHPRQPRRVSRSVPDAERLPESGSRTWVGDHGRRAWRSSAAGRRSPGRSSCTGCAVRRRASAQQIEIYTGGTVEIIENGGTAWSIDAGGELPGSAKPLVVVRVHVDDPKEVDCCPGRRTRGRGEARARRAPGRDRAGWRKKPAASPTHAEAASAGDADTLPTGRRVAYWPVGVAGTAPAHGEHE